VGEINLKLKPGAKGADGGAGATGPEGQTGPSVTFTNVEVSLGSAPDGRRSGSFTIAGTGLTAGKQVVIQQAAGPYTGKGARQDEAGMDMLHVTGYVADATTIRCYWNSQFRVRGNFKFNYYVSP
jgi:hypothetical protein